MNSSITKKLGQRPLGKIHKSNSWTNNNKLGKTKLGQIHKSNSWTNNNKLGKTQLGNIHKAKGGIQIKYKKLRERHLENFKKNGRK